MRLIITSVQNVDPSELKDWPIDPTINGPITFIQTKRNKTLMYLGYLNHYAIVSILAAEVRSFKHAHRLDFTIRSCE